MFTSLFSITSMMLILGLFLMLAVNINTLSENAEDQFDMVEIYLQETISEDQQNDLINEIGCESCVDQVTYVSKEKALKIMKRRWGDKGYLLEGLSENPLPSSLQVHLNNISEASSFVKSVRGKNGVEDVAYRQEEIRKILKITRTVQAGAMVVIVFLLIISVVVVSNTIRLTVLARGRAISIMRYVGATNWFIRGPFLAEGILIGMTAAVISSLVVSGLYFTLSNRLTDRILVMCSLQMMPAATLSFYLTLIFLTMGMTIGASGSLISMRKFLEK